MDIIKPSYYDSFRCLASACPDSCCKEWDVDVDEESAARYRGLPGDLGNRLRQCLVETEYGTQMAAENGRCPMWRADGLCRIQAEMGEEYLCEVCREFPRLHHDYGDFMELGLELSCPEAARLILTTLPEKPVLTQVPGGEAPEYDPSAMNELLTMRSRVLLLLESSSASAALTEMLLYSNQMQASLDGENARAANPLCASQTGRTKEQEPEDFFNFFKKLEILTPRWEELLSRHIVQPLPPQTSLFARYLVERYWLQSISDYDLKGRVKFIVIACLLVGSLPGDYVQNAQLFSKEIENDVDNVDALLEAAAKKRCFATTRLLAMLRRRETRQ